MTENLTLLITGTSDATPLVQSLTWSGGYNQCARTLEFDLVTSSVDKRLPAINAELGNRVQLYIDGSLRFDGFIFSRRFDGKNTKSLTCADRGFYLNRNEASYKFRSMTPEAITAMICTDFGIEAGNIAKTGVTISRNFPGTRLYSIIQTAYTLASLETGKKYMLRFRGAALDVIAKEPDSSTPVLKPGANLLSVSVTETLETMINRVVITDENDNQVAIREDANAIKLYGLPQTVLRRQEGEDTGAKAQKLIDDNGLVQKITVTNLGDPSLISGNCVVLQEPITGLYGLFWIDSDTHTWRNGVYQNKLVLNFRNIMDEAEAGSLPVAGSGGSGSGRSKITF